MKRLIYLIFILICSNSITAQTEFAPIGATWTYKYSDAWGNGPTCYVKSIGDTVVQGKACRILKTWGTGCTLRPTNLEYVYEENGKVYLYFAIRDAFIILYDFQKLVGESYSMKLYNSDSVTFLVDSVATFDFNGNELKVQFVHVSHPIGGGYTGYGGQILENIGNWVYFFPWTQNTCNEYHCGPIVCYSDSIIGEYKWNNTLECHVDSIILPKPNKFEISYASSDSTNYIFALYPNPSNGTIDITLENGTTDILIYDVFGRCIRNFKYSGIRENFTIDMSDEAKGIYILKIYSKMGDFIRKIVID